MAAPLKVFGIENIDGEIVPTLDGKQMDLDTGMGSEYYKTTSYKEGKLRVSITPRNLDDNRAYNIIRLSGIGSQPPELTLTRESYATLRDFSIKGDRDVILKGLKSPDNPTTAILHLAPDLVGTLSPEKLCRDSYYHDRGMKGLGLEGVRPYGPAQLFFQGDTGLEIKASIPHNQFVLMPPDSECPSTDQLQQTFRMNVPRNHRQLAADERVVESPQAAPGRETIDDITAKKR